MNNLIDDFKETTNNLIKFKSNYVGVVNISCYSSVPQVLQIKNNDRVLSEYVVDGNRDINYVIKAIQSDQLYFVIKAPRTGVFEIKVSI